MVVVKFWILLAVTVLVATIITARNVPAVETTTEWPSLIKREALVVSSNRTKLQRKWKDPMQGGKWHFQTPNRVLPYKKFQDVGKKTLEVSTPISFSRRLIQNLDSQNIVQQALSTTFIGKMAEGILPLKNYNRFLAQDAAYFNHVADVYHKAAKAMEENSNEKYATFYWKQSAKFSHFHRQLIQEKHISGQGEEGAALKAYKDFLNNVAHKNLAVAMLPCSMLYPELAKKTVQNPETNVYETDFFQVNRRNDESSTERFVNAIEDITEDVALPIFRAGLRHELEFLKEVCDCEDCNSCALNRA